MGELVVLSLFDGLSCGQIALNRVGYKIKKYYASEIDKHAIKVTHENYPNTIQLGDVQCISFVDGWICIDEERKYYEPFINLVIGGSPCTGFSLAGKGLNFSDPQSKLFFDYLRILNEVKAFNPDVKFLLENVMMKKEYKNAISKHMGINPICINASLVSAQNRERLFWTNIKEEPFDMFGHTQCMIPQPEDKGIILKDILEDNVDGKYFLSDKALDRILRNKYSKPKINPEKTGTLNTKNNSGQLSVDSGTTLIQQGCVNDKGNIRITEKSQAIDANYWKGMDNHAQRSMVILSDRGIGRSMMEHDDGKTPPLRAHQGSSHDVTIVHSLQPRNGKGQGGKGHLSKLSNKAYCLDSLANQAIEQNMVIRRLTPKECERLQCVPDDYTKSVSDTQRYRMLGNGWNVDVIAHIFKYL